MEAMKIVLLQNAKTSYFISKAVCLAVITMWNSVI